MFAIFEEDGFFVAVEDNVELAVFETEKDAWTFLEKITE